MQLANQHTGKSARSYSDRAVVSPLFLHIILVSTAGRWLYGISDKLLKKVFLSRLSFSFSYLKDRLGSHRRFLTIRPTINAHYPTHLLSHIYTNANCAHGCRCLRPGNVLPPLSFISLLPFCPLSCWLLHSSANTSCLFPPPLPSISSLIPSHLVFPPASLCTII